MLKFKFDYQANTLVYQKPYQTEYWHEIAEQFEASFGGQGFQLSNGWITFTVYANKIRVFYKQITVPWDSEDFWEPTSTAYYRKDLPKQAPVVFEFTSDDEVGKVGSAWVKKNKVLSETKGGNHG